MSHDLDSILSLLKPTEPPNGFHLKVIQHIRAKQRHSAIARIALFSIGLIGSVAALFPALHSAQSALAESGFTAYLSLAFSDTGVVMSAWQNFTLALLESLPILSLISVLAVLFIFLESAQQLAASMGPLFFRPNRH